MRVRPKEYLIKTWPSLRYKKARSRASKLPQALLLLLDARGIQDLREVSAEHVHGFLKTCGAGPLLAQAAPTAPVPFWDTKPH